MLALTLFSDQLVLAVAADNSAIGETISFGELPYIETRIASETETLGEQVMRRQSRQPRVRVWFSNFQQTLAAVTHSDMVAMVPSKSVTMHGRQGLRTLSVLFEVPTIEERILTPHDLDTAEAIFLCNSVRGLRRITNLIRSI